MNRNSFLFTFVVSALIFVSLSYADPSTVISDSVRFAAIDTLHWNYATASDRLLNPMGDTIQTVSAAKWMIAYLAHPDTSLTDSVTWKRFLLMSYMSLSRMAVPSCFPLFLDGINHSRKGVRNASISGIFCLSLVHYLPAQNALDSLAKNAKGEEIRKQAAYFITRLDRYKKMGVQY